MGATKEKSEYTRKHIMQIALRMFADKGFSTCRLEDIAHAAGVTRGAIYWHFKNKTDLFMQIFTEKIKELFGIIFPIAYHDIPPIEKIRMILKTIVEKLSNDPDMRAIALLQYNIEWTREIHQKLMEALKNLNVDEVKPLVKIIEEAKESGEISTIRDTMTLVHLIRIFIHGMAHIILDEFEKISVKEINSAIDEFVVLLKK
ncbi:MAG: TetR family transcriptional regulator [Calditrichia bacterium]